ncbi:hypothetical protein HK098_007121 [Nowakowskiella sp. JEL0407]|nr:hypothetical protein HK098_007121 [Nowakowskiella sp. JEL0407]
MSLSLRSTNILRRNVSPFNSLKHSVIPSLISSHAFSTIAALRQYNTHNNSPNFGSKLLAERRRRQLPTNTVVKFVPQQEAWVVERMGKFRTILEPGLAILIPFLDKIRYVQSLKELAVEIGHQAAITQDNVTILMDGVLYYKIVDPYQASYGVEDCDFAIAQLAQTTMRAEIGRLTLDRTLAERTQLNLHIVEAINHAAKDWGIKCLRYEIRDIHPPENVVSAMHQQVSAERNKRAEILESEGRRQAAINVSEGKKASIILESEAARESQINKAIGDAENIRLKAEASAAAIKKIAEALQANGSQAQDALTLTVAEKYVEAFGKMAKESTTLIVPGNVGDASAMVAQIMSTFDVVKNSRDSGIAKNNLKRSIETAVNQ